ncbi:hypothetical protein J3R30DRAFT_1124860 [Lentinula aciculospora]|uniref:Uncharacterized protein n=1 Tax=Lentinula aciculospora TaxID=153920 RepID=A0A9W9A1H8_9AGAR|nr:hypothetical protein J3R30DRAFT_1124860 [Lentinula aciculospora]
MSLNAILYVSQPVIALWTQFLPRILFGRSSSMMILSFGAATFAGGLGISLYSAYLDLRCLWIEHQLARTVELLDKMEAKNAAANRRYEALQQVTSRGRRMMAGIERWEAGRKELEKMIIFKQLPVTCAITDDTDPQFEGYNVTVRKRDLKRKMKEMNALDNHLEEEMKWWNAEGPDKECC